MIKGCAKRVVVVKDVDSKLFEEAYFIVRPQHVKNEEEYLGEAEKLLKEDAASVPCGLTALPVRQSTALKIPQSKKNARMNPKKTKKQPAVRGVLPFCLGMLLGVTICAFLRLIGLV